MKNIIRIHFGKAALLLIVIGLTSFAAVCAPDNYNINFQRDSIIPVKSQQSFIELYKLKQMGLLNTAKDDGDFLIFEKKQSLSIFRVEKRLWQIFMLGTLTELSAPNSLDYDKLSDHVEYKDFPLLYNKLNSDKDYKPEVDQEKNLASFQFENSRKTVIRSDWSLFSAGIFVKNPRFNGAVKTE